MRRGDYRNKKEATMVKKIKMLVVFSMFMLLSVISVHANTISYSYDVTISNTSTVAAISGTTSVYYTATNKSYYLLNGGTSVANITKSHSGVPGDGYASARHTLPTNGLRFTRVDGTFRANQNVHTKTKIN